MSTTDRTTNPEQRLAPGRWRLDASRSRAEFRVPHTWGLATVKGHFTGQDGWLVIDADQHWSMELTLDAASLDTGNRMRDKDLRSDKFFDVDHHPTVRFRSTNVIPVGDRLSVTGELTAGGSTVRIQAETTISVSGDEIELDAQTTLDQRQLGMTHSPLGMVRTPSTVRVRARLRPQS